MCICKCEFACLPVFHVRVTSRGMCICRKLDARNVSDVIIIFDHVGNRLLVECVLHGIKECVKGMPRVEGRNR